MTLAIDLAQRGVEVTVAEQHRAGEPTTIRWNHIFARSMELFRRLGITSLLRENGLPADYPCDAAYFTTLTGLLQFLAEGRCGRRCQRRCPGSGRARALRAGCCARSGTVSGVLLLFAGMQ
jgi:hypothetical protein